MPPEDDIVQRIILSGDKAAIAQFQAVGDAGAVAFAKANAAASLTGKAFSKVGGSLADVLRNLRQTGHDSEEAAKGLEAANKGGTSFATTLRLLGRATRVRELSQLGRTLGVLGRAFSVAAPAIFAAGLGAVAQAGTSAARKFNELALETKVTTEQMGDLQAAGTGVGLSLEDAAKTFKAINDAAGQAAENVDKNAKEFRTLEGTLQDTRNAGDAMVEGFHRIAVEGQNAFREFQKATQKISDDGVQAAQSLSNSLRDIQEQRDAINGVSLSKAEQRARQLRNLDEQEAKLKADAAKADRERVEQQVKLNSDFEEGQRKRRLELIKLNQEIDKNARAEKEAVIALAKAHVEAEKNATSFEKLGIETRLANGKLKDTPELLSELATALEKLKDPLERRRIDFALVKDGIEAQFIPALRKGAAEFAKLQALNLKIRPAFDDKQIAIANDFAIAVHQVGAAFAALIDELGVAIAPDLIPFLNKVRDILVEIRPGLVEFGKSLAGVLGPALTALANVIQTVIVPAFQTLSRFLTFIADQFNKWTGSTLTGSDLLVTAIGLLLIAFGGLPLAITAAFIALAPLINKISDLGLAGKILLLALGLIAAWFLGWGALIALVIAGVALLVSEWDGLKASAMKVADAMVKLWEDFKQRVIAIFTGIGQSISDTWDRVKDKVKALLGFRASNQGSSSSSDTGTNFSQGGHVRGPGSGTSDSIPMWGSNGEWMMRAAAVRKYGLGLMQSINSLRFNAEGFNMGGLISFNAPQPSMRYAQGGLVSSKGGTLNLTIGNEEFKNLRAPEDTMKNLTRYANDRKVRSAGRKQAWRK